MKLRAMMVMTMLVFCSLLHSQSKPVTGKKYIKNSQASIANAGSDGQTVGVLAKGTEVTVLEEGVTMAKVQITAWIPKTELTTTRALRALHIAVKTRAEAEALLADIKTGKDFMELAQKKSILPNAAKGGDLGYFNKGDFDAKVEGAIEALDVNQISPIIETSFGFNIFKRIQ
jgi:parvulin-like peptidyl-prolyl isomerase